MIVSPFYKLSKTAEKRLTTILLISLLLISVVMRYFDAPLKNPVSSYGIVSFELAKDLSQSEAILTSWDAIAKTAAGMSMGMDFLFLIMYSLFISLLIHTLNERLWKHTKMYKMGLIFIWGVFLAAFFDIIENIALIQLLMGDLQQHWSTMAYYFAILKFGLVALSVLYILINFILLTVKNLRTRFK